MPVFSTRYSTLPALLSRDRARHVHGHGAELRVRHQAARAEHAAEPADHAHHVRRRDHAVELEPVLVLDLLGEVLGAHEVGARLARLVLLVALGEDQDAHRACRCRAAARSRRAPSGRRASGRRPGSPRGRRSRRTSPPGISSSRPKASAQRVAPRAVDLLETRAVALASRRHHSPSTSRPIERAVPATIFIAASRSLAFRSGILSSAISRTWALRHLADLVAVRLARALLDLRRLLEQHRRRRRLQLEGEGAVRVDGDHRRDDQPLPCPACAR